MTSDIDGRCHCGAVHWRVTTPVPAERMPIWICQCSFCVKHSVRYTSWSDAALALWADDREQVGTYQLGHGTADFILCRRCGTVLAAVMEDTDGLCGVVNFNTADNPKQFSKRPHYLDFEGETVDERRARRKKFWIGSVAWLERPPLDASEPAPVSSGETPAR